MSDVPPTRFERWRKRLVKYALIGVLVVVLADFSAPFLLSFGLTAAGRAFGLSVQVADIDLVLVDGDLEVRGLDVRSEGRPLLSLDYMAVDVDLSRVLRGDLTLNRVETDGLTLHVDRSAQGRWNFESLLASSSDPDEATDADGGEPPELRFDLPVHVAALRAQNIVVSVTDNALEPPFVAQLWLNARLDNAGSRDRSARLSVLGHAPGILDSVVVEAELTAERDDAELALDVSVAGLHPQSLRSYLEPLGLFTDADSLSLEMKAKLRADVADEERTSARLEASLSDLLLRADLEDFLSVEKMSVSAPSLSGAGAHIELAEMRGVRGHAHRSSDGVFHLAGLDVAPTPKLTEAVAGLGIRIGRAALASLDLRVLPTDVSAVNAVHDAATQFPVVCDRIVARDVVLAFDDEAIEPALHTELRVDEATLENIVLDRTRAEIARLSISASSPPVLETISVTGTASLFGEPKTMDLKLEVGGIALDALRPYLEPAGLEPVLQDGTFTGRVDVRVVNPEPGRLLYDAALLDVELRDGEEQLTAVKSVGVRGGEMNHARAENRLESFVVSGTRMAVTRDRDGGVLALGLRFAPQANASPETAPTVAPTIAPAASAPTPPDPVAPPAATDKLPSFLLGRIACEDTQLIWRDEKPAVPTEIELDELGFEVTNLRFGGFQEEGNEPGRIKVFFAEPGLVREFVVEGTLASRPGAFNMDVDVVARGRGLSTQEIEIYLAELGLESPLRDGSLDARMKWDIVRDPDAVRMNFAIEDVAFVESNVELAALRALRVSGIALGREGVVIGRVEVDGPLVRAKRLADGALAALGLRVPASKGGPGGPGDSGAPGDPRAPGAKADTPLVLPAAGLGDLGISIGDIGIRDARVVWKDDAIDPPLDTSLVVSFETGDLVLGGGARNAFTVDASVDGLLESLRVTGQLELGAERIGVESHVALAGLDFGGLAGYFPAGVEPALEGGALELELTAHYAINEQGGYGAAVQVRDFRYRDPKRTLIGFDHFSVEVPRVDLDGGELAVTDFSLAGLEIDARRDERGQILLAGLALTESGDAPGVAAGKPTERRAVASPASEDPVATAATARTPQRPPLAVALEGVSLELAKFSFVDESRPGSVPLAAHMTLVMPQREVFGGVDPELLPPVDIQIDGVIDPVIGEVDVDLQLRPFLREPEVRCTLALSGMRGAGITELVPELAETLDGSGLENGVLESEVVTHLRVRRRGPMDFDIAGGFGLEVLVHRFAFRESPDADVSLGAEGIHLDVHRIVPGTGAVHARLLEIDRPLGRVTFEPEGLRVLGLLIKTPTAAAPVDPAQPVQVVASAKPARELPDVRLDQFVVQGVDFIARDTTVQPEFVMPLADLDVAVRGLGTGVFTGDQFARFDANITSADVNLPVRAGAPDEPRPAFDAIDLNGQISLGEHFDGWAELEVRGFELLSLRGPALTQGIVIKDGVYDGDVRVRFQGERGVAVKMKNVFRFLSLSEDENGPIRKALKLPVPLDTTLFIVRDSNGKHVVPVSFRVAEDGLDMASVISAAVTAAGKVLAKAITSSPFRIAGGVVDLGGKVTGAVGLGIINETLSKGLSQAAGWVGLGEKPLELDPLTLTYAPGATLLRNEEWGLLAPYLKVMRKRDDVKLVVAHEFGGGDLERAELLANPDPDDCFELARRLRTRRLQLAEEREVLSAEVLAAYLEGQDEEALARTADLRRVDRELGLNEDALDAVLDLTRQGGDRRRDRRTKETSLSIARLRLGAFLEKVRQAGIDGAEGRIEIRRPRFRHVEGQEGGRLMISAKLKDSR